MPAAAFGELARVSSNRLLINARKTHGYSVRKKKTVVKYPDRLHMPYIALDATAQLTVRHLAVADVKKSNIDSKEKGLYKAAKDNVEKNLPISKPYEDCGKDFSSLVFYYPCHFTIVVDENGWELYFPAPAKETEVIKDETHDPIVFIDKKTVVESSSNDGTTMTVKIQEFAENHAFFNVGNTPLFDPANNPATKGDAIRMINFHTNEKGQPIKKGDPTINYGFEIYLRVPSAAKGLQEHLTTIIIDPDGQNQGPPVNPPPP